MAELLDHQLLSPPSFLARRPPPPSPCSLSSASLFASRPTRSPAPKLRPTHATPAARSIWGRAAKDLGAVTSREGERGHRRPISLDAWVAGGGAAGAVRACMLEEDGRGKAQEAECNVLLVFQCNHKLLQLSAAGRSEPV